jgi:hypothetical protein
VARACTRLSSCRFVCIRGSSPSSVSFVASSEGLWPLLRSVSIGLDPWFNPSAFLRVDSCPLVVQPVRTHSEVRKTTDFGPRRTDDGAVRSEVWSAATRRRFVWRDLARRKTLRRLRETLPELISELLAPFRGQFLRVHSCRFVSISGSSPPFPSLPPVRKAALDRIASLRETPTAI